MNRRQKSMLAFAGVLMAAHLVMRFAGVATHTSILAGMPQSDASYVLGPLYVLVHLAATVVAPIVALAAVVDAGLARARR